MGMDIRQTNCPSRHKGALGGGFRVQTLKSLGKQLSNGWTDWHQVWFTSEDSSGNGHRLNPSRPSIPQGAFRGGGVTHSKAWESCQTDAPINTKFGTRRRIRLEMDIGLLQFAPQYPRAFGGGGLMGPKFKCLGKLSNGWTTDWHHIWYKSADSSGNRHRLNTIRPSLRKGVSGGHKCKSPGKLSNSWTD